MSSSKKLIQAAAGNAAGGGFYPYTIDNSVRFNPGDSPHLYRSSYSCSRTTWTVSFWLKRSDNPETGTYNYIFDQGTTSGTSNQQTYFYQRQLTANYDYVAPTSIYATQADYIRDLSAWYHFVLVWDSTNATSTDRIRIYKNGVRSNLSASAMPSQNHQGQVGNSAYPFYIGRYSYSTQYNLDGYLADWHFIDGQALDSSYFGETKNGVWIPKEYTGTYSGNSYHLDFADSSDLGKDVSGNGNNFTSSGLTSSDQMLDTPTNNFCTYNPIDTDRANLTFSEGNIKIVKAAASDSPKATTTMGVTSGKWYWETAWSSFGASGNWYLVMEVTTREQWAVSNAYNTVQYFASSDGSINGYKRINTNGSYVTSAYGSGFSTSGDIVGVALDLDSGTVTFYKNGVSQGAISLPSTTEAWFPAWTTDGTSNYATHITNFGQDGSFAGTKTAQGNTDANGLGDFYYTVPSGHLALCTANLPEPTIGPNIDSNATGTTSDEHFNTVLYTGTGSARSVTGFGFQPDNLAIKTRSISNHWHNVDAVRGVSNALAWSGTYAEFTSALNSFDSDGFSVYDAQASVNDSGTTYVAYGWKANGSGVSNTDGSITSTVSANTDAGISIVTYTGNATSGATVGHGLGVAPSAILVKTRSISNSWHVYLKPNGATKVMLLDTTASVYSGNSAWWNNTEPSSTVFTLGNGSGTNNSGTMVAYCFAEIEGFSKIGSYTGNGSSDGPMIVTNFRPAWIMVKNTSASGNWWIEDTSRSPYNVGKNKLAANTSDAETTSYDNFDLLSNGFKVRNSGTELNGSGNTIIYMAFAEMPFKYSVGR